MSHIFSLRKLVSNSSFFLKIYFLRVRICDFYLCENDISLQSINNVSTTNMLSSDQQVDNTYIMWTLHPLMPRVHTVTCNHFAVHPCFIHVCYTSCIGILFVAVWRVMCRKCINDQILPTQKLSNQCLCFFTSPTFVSWTNVLLLGKYISIYVSSRTASLLKWVHIF